MIISQRFATELPIHPGRYRLVVSPRCPFCRRVTIARRLLGLEAIISISYASGAGADGFEFVEEGLSFDPILKARTQRELYRRDPRWQVGDSTSVPIILDEKDGQKIVATESAEILQDLCTVWKPFWEYGVADLYPEEKREEIDQLDQELAQGINRLVSKYIHEVATEEEKKELAIGLEKMESRLANTRYLLGEQTYECDIRLFVSLQALVAYEADALADFAKLRTYYDTLFHTPGWVSPEEAKALDPQAEVELAAANSAVTACIPK